MTTEELRETMTRNGDALSYPYWATQTLLWNGEAVTVSAPSPAYPINQTDEE